jgi:hypothetical protein
MPYTPNNSETQRPLNVESYTPSASQIQVKIGSLGILGF